ncbi:MAG: PolC-type DNA polymerase III [Candidatus Marinamargulisbacteria bacterium]
MHRVVVLDFETYPLDGKSLIMEIGCVEIIDGVIGKTYSTLVKPETRVSDFVLNLTGIDHDALDEAPLFTEVYLDFYKFIKNSTIIAHNAFLDRMSYMSVCDYYHLVPESFIWVDSQDVFKWFHPTIRSLQLQQLFHQFDISQAQSHRALDDAMGLAQLMHYFSKHYSLKISTFEVALLKQSQQKSIQHLIRFVLRFFSVGAPDNQHDRDMDHHGYAEFDVDRIGQRHATRCLGDDSQLQSYVTDHDQRTIYIVRSKYSLDMPFIDSPSNYAFPPNIDSFYPRLMQQAASHSEVVEIIAIIGWLRQTKTFYLNDLNDSLKQRFYQINDSSMDSKSMEKTTFLALHIEAAFQSNQSVSCHIETFSQISMQLPKFCSLFAIVYYHFSNYDGVFSELFKQSISSYSFKFLNDMIIQFSSVIRFLTRKEEHPLKLIQDIARIRHAIDLIHYEKNQMLQQFDALIGALSVNHYYSQREVYVNDNVKETFEWQEIIGHIHLIQHHITELTTILGRVSYYIVPQLSVWIRDIILKVNAFGFMLKQLLDVSDRDVLFIASPLKYRPSNCSLVKLSIFPTELFQNVMNYAQRVIIHQSAAVYTSTDFFTWQIGSKLVDEHFDDASQPGVSIMARSDHEIVSFIQSKLSFAPVHVVVLSKQKMRYWKKKLHRITRQKYKDRPHQVQFLLFSDVSKLNSLSGIIIFPDYEPPNASQPVHQARMQIMGMQEEDYYSELLKEFLQFLPVNFHHLSVNELVLNLPISVFQHISTKELVQ